MLFRNIKVIKTKNPRGTSPLKKKNKTNETWQQNIMCKPGLDPGLGWTIAIKDFIGTIDES